MAPHSALETTLQPLRDDGPDALDTHDIPAIAKATLCLLEVTSDCAHKSVITFISDDIFKAAAGSNEPNPVPKTGNLTCAILVLRLAPSYKLVTLAIRPPHIIELDDPSPLPVVERWLALRHFKIPRLLAKAAIILLIAVATAAAFDDSFTDDDDDNDERTKVSSSSSFSPAAP